jgi:hypothetical protein
MLPQTPQSLLVLILSTLTRRSSGANVCVLMFQRVCSQGANVYVLNVCVLILVFQGIFQVRA